MEKNYELAVYQMRIFKWLNTNDKRQKGRNGKFTIISNVYWCKICLFPPVSSENIIKREKKKPRVGDRYFPSPAEELWINTLFFRKTFGDMNQRGLQNSCSLIHKFYFEEITWRINNWWTEILIYIGHKIILVKFGHLWLGVNYRVAYPYNQILCSQ